MLDDVILLDVIDDVVKILKIDQTSTDDQTRDGFFFLADKFFFIF